jgi:hypothetical protein
LRIDRVTIALACAVAFVASCCSAQQPHQPTALEQRSLKEFLKAHERQPHAQASAAPAASFKSAFVDLKDDGTFEVFVYRNDPFYCGSGGCNLLILAPTSSSYRIVADTTITRPPIRVLTHKTNGWHDISVWVSGGGIIPGYAARLAFNGRSYPSNPSVPPAQPLKGKAAGWILIARDAQ